ncbi:MAG: MFS transporter [Elusimicrobiota bacterium]|nr:MAG: MFS transporter [Elusimicrobiota bacterium]
MDEARRRLRWELIVLACMYAGYMGFILCRTAIYVASPAMVGDPALGLTKTAFGAILGWGTAGMVTGKLLSGAVADRLGGRTVFLLALAVTAACAGAFAVAGSFAAFCALNFAMLLCAAAGWPAMSKIIAAWYEPDRYGKVWGVISTSSRLSSVLSTLVLGRLLLLASWPKVFVAAAALTAVVIAAIALFLKRGPADAGLPRPSRTPPARPPRTRSTARR